MMTLEQLKRRVKELSDMEPPENLYELWVKALYRDARIVDGLELWEDRIVKDIVERITK